jgi:hypothetical protein
MPLATALAMGKKIADRRQKVDNLTQKAQELFGKMGHPSPNKRQGFTNPPRWIVGGK